MATQAESVAKEEVNGLADRLNNWKTPGTAAFNFKSDTSTTPTLAMLNSITYATLLDDMTKEDPTTNALEARIAELLGQPAGVLTSSGTMGNQLAARCHLGRPPHSLVADARSHIIGYEAGGVASNSATLPIPVEPAAGKTHLTLEEVQARTVLSQDIHFAPTGLISLENTIHGAIFPLEECRRICEWARSQGISTHLDGARLWDAVSSLVAADESVPREDDDAVRAALVAGLRAYGSLFDSVTVCFSKGLGAPIGSLLAGSTEFVARARHVRKSWGGAMRMTGIIAAPAGVAVDDTFFGGRLVRAHDVARRVAELWKARGGELVSPVETNMVWIDLSGGRRAEVWEAAAAANGLSVYGGKRGRIVCHYQISDEAVERLDRVFEAVMAEDLELVARHAAASKSGFAGYGGGEAARVADAAGDADEGK